MDSTTVLSPELFARLSSFITRELGIKMPPQKLPMLQSRLQRRVRQLSAASMDQYCESLFDPSNQDELVHFIDLVTTNKTDFLREPQHFDYLTRRVLPELSPAGAPAGNFKVWCAGCSSGEEPYTLAMVLQEYAEQQAGFNFSIFATDISVRKLQEAKEAIYEDFKVEPLPMEWRKKYLLRSKDPAQRLVRVGAHLRAKVSFGRLNFMDAEYPVREVFDVIFHRNVLIYFDKPTQEAVVNKLCRHLRAGGYLFVGHSESLAGLDIPARSVAASVLKRLP